MSKRSRAQRDIERAHKDELAQARPEHPGLFMYPKDCSTQPCHRPATVAVILKGKNGVYQGWGGCVIHAEKLSELFLTLKGNLEAMKSLAVKLEAATLDEQSDDSAVSAASIPGSSGVVQDAGRG